MSTKSTIGIPRKIFTVIIRKQEYDVYDIDGKEHASQNGEPNTWWLYYESKLPDGLIPPADSEHFVPYSKSINRRLWDIRISQYNSSKVKWDEHHFSSGTNVEMYCNGKLIYSFGTFDLNFAFAKIQYLQVILSEHCFNFFEPEKEDGRKIWWYGLPATIKIRKSAPWEITIYPDLTTGLSEEQWWIELEKKESNYKEKPSQDKEIDEMYKAESRRDGCINWGDALSDEHIGWFRE